MPSAERRGYCDPERSGVEPSQWQIFYNPRELGDPLFNLLFLTSGETEAQREAGTCPRSHCESVEEQRPNPG